MPRHQQFTVRDLGAAKFRQSGKAERRSGALRAKRSKTMKRSGTTKAKSKAFEISVVLGMDMMDWMPSREEPSFHHLLMEVTNQLKKMSIQEQEEPSKMMAEITNKLKRLSLQAREDPAKAMAQLISQLENFSLEPSQAPKAARTSI
ncbi:hypothetical protein BSKO_12527 [Bryopsis sp. KO-2023]|nr:hypothetical protein BSKO_12527 [Bryopsis sp. KO-2023]